MKNRLKSIATPRTWAIKRKKNIWTMKPKGPHKLEQSLPLATLFKDFLKYAKTTKEVQTIITTKGVLINNKKAKDVHASVGLMDIMEIPEIKEKYILLINTRGKLYVQKTELDTKICKIIGKKVIKGKVQLNLFGGENIVVEKDEYKTGDSLLINLKDNKIKDNLKLEKGANCILLSGSHTGEIGKIKDIEDKEKMTITSKEKDFETLKESVYVIGKDKPLIEIIEK